MPTFQCPNPACLTQSEIPDKFVGMKVRCKQCHTEFMAGNRPAASPPAVPPLPRTVITSPPPLAPTTQAKKAPTTASTKVSTVAAVWREPGGGGRGVGWLVAAFVAFLLPIAGATGYLALREPPKAAPPASDLYAGIEVGSSGVTYTVFDVTKAGNKFDYEVLLSESRTTNINEGMATTGVFDKTGMAASVKAVRECYKKLTVADKIPAENISVVTSGGLLATLEALPPDRRKESIEENQRELRKAIKTAIDKTIDFIEAEEEAAFQLDAVVEPGNIDESVYVDIGSGGTRGAYLDGAGRLRKLKLYGIKELVEQGKTQRLSGGFASGNGKDLASSSIAGAYREQSKQAEGFATRKNVYLGGGIVWVLSLATHRTEQAASDKKLHILLSVEDIEGFVADIRKKKDFRQDYLSPVGMSDEDSKKLQAEAKRSYKPFPPEKLAAGAEILSTLATEMKLSGRTVKFPRYANVAWVMGYIAKQNGWKR